MSQSSRNNQPDARVAQVKDFIKSELPQIKMHGGESTVFFPAPDSQTVHIELSGTCSGCGLSPMTSNILRQRLVEEFNAIDHVKVSLQSQHQTPRRGDASDAPF